MTEKRNTRDRLAFFVRAVTVPPVMAAVLIITLSLNGTAFTGYSLPVCLFCLSILPLAAYPLSVMIRTLRNKKRKAQRTLAVCLSVAGYIIATVYTFIERGSVQQKVILITYLVSGILIFAFSGALKIRISGHTCGMSGPVFALCVYRSPWCAFLMLLQLPVIRSSLLLKRHTLPELLAGCAVPVAVQMILMQIIR